VLVEGDEMNEPVSDAVRGILDGHVVLSRRLASANHFPAIDVLSSISRVMPVIVSGEHMTAASRVRDMLSTYEEARDLINIGAYKEGSNAQIDPAVSPIEEINRFLRQDMNEKCAFQDSIDRLAELARP
jgi:flagellar biosynthesis/type III secretory pathway ATPase